MIRTKGEAGSGNIVEAVRHMRLVQDGIRRLTNLRADEMMAEAKLQEIELKRGILHREELNVQEMVRILGMNQPRVSKHLAVLRDAGWLRQRKEEKR